MSRITDTFAKNKSLLICYITAGDPQLNMTVDFMHSLVDAGVDIIELGVPFTDPLADGPVIQKASERALQAGVNLDKIFTMVKDFRHKNSTTPVILMGYLNPIEVYGYGAYATKAKQVGVDGVLTVDLPISQSQDLQSALSRQGLDTIFLISPTSTEQRIKETAQKGTGFVYYVSLNGITGASNLDIKQVKNKIQALKLMVGIPVVVGFGISSPEQAKQLKDVCDGVVVGSALVRVIEENSQCQTAKIQQKLYATAKSFADVL